MVLESKAAAAGSVFALTGILAAFESLGTVGQDLVLAAAAIAALKIIGGSMRSVIAGAREVHAAVTSSLPERMDAVELKQAEAAVKAEEAAVEAALLRATMEAWGAAEAGVVRGTIQAMERQHEREHVPRQARSSDPGVRTGWRE
jgi:hypothetical protein